MNDSSRNARLERWRARAMRALRAGDADATLRSAKHIMSIDPGDADAHFLAGLSQLQEGKLEVAAGYLKRAAELDPDRADYWAQLALCLTRMNRQTEAVQAAERAAALPSDDAVTRNSLGSALANLGRHSAAVEHFEAAASLMPDNLGFQCDLAQGLIHVGEFDRARDISEQVIEINPDYWRAHLTLAGLLDGPPPRQRVDQLDAALARVSGNAHAEVIYGHALARTLEAAGDRARAFAVWEKTRTAMKQAIGYAIEEDRALFTYMEHAFDAGTIADTRPGDPTQAPIFVVGMPRTGTTLVERILSAHSMVSAGGELTHLPHCISAAWSSDGAPVPDTRAIDAALAEDPAQIGANYLQLARVQVGDAPRYVDKMPLNFFFTGFIRRALPNAKIVCLRRGALDTCLANFRQLFALQYPQYRYALSLMDTAEYFALFERLMAHWDRLFPGAIHYVNYERLVAEPETEIRRLLEYLELDFEPGVIHFEDNRAPVATASAMQVRRSIYPDAVESWRRYEAEFEPVKQRLIELGVALTPAPAAAQ